MVNIMLCYLEILSISALLISVGVYNARCPVFGDSMLVIPDTTQVYILVVGASYLFVIQTGGVPRIIMML